MVPPFLYSVVPAGSSNDGGVVPSGYVLASSAAAPGGGGFRQTHPHAFHWSGTASTPPVRLTWQAGTLFDSVFNGATGGFVPFRIVSAASSEPGGSPTDPADLPMAAEPAGEDPGPASLPGPLPLAGLAVAWRCSRRLGQRLRRVR